jgi:hypothetical protein
MPLTGVAHDGVMAFPLSPAALADFARSTIGQMLETAAAAATVPVRVMGLLGQAELLVNRITVIAGEAEALIQRVTEIADEAQETVVEARTIATTAGQLVERAGITIDGASTLVVQAGEITKGAATVMGRASGITDAADTLVVRATDVSDAASAVVEQAATAAGDAAELLEAYAGTLRKGAPLAARFVEELSLEEVTAAIRMIDQLPKLREHLINDVMPLLGKLDQVGPDLHKLLEVTEDLRLAIAGLPGLRMLRRRGEDREDAKQ